MASRAAAYVVGEDPWVRMVLFVACLVKSSVALFSVLDLNTMFHHLGLNPALPIPRHVRGLCPITLVVCKRSPHCFASPWLSSYYMCCFHGQVSRGKQ